MGVELDALFFFRHNINDDFEIRYALRGVARNMPWVRKVWVFGDKPRFLSEDTSIVEHVPHEFVARVGNFRTPITNGFLMCYLSSLIPDLSEEYIRFSDDFFVIGPLSIEDARKDRYIGDMSTAQRAPGLWNESLWRTYDFLKRLGYPGYNFETHAPAYLTKKRVFEAYCDLKDFVTEDRFYGLIGPTAVMNHAVKMGGCDLVHRGQEGRWVGFYQQAPSYKELVKLVEGKTFLNCDDPSLTEGVRRFLMETFPEPCKYENPDAGGVSIHRSSAQVRNGEFPEPILPSRTALTNLLNDRSMASEGVVIGQLTAKFSKTLLEAWRGRLHCVNSQFDQEGSEAVSLRSASRDRCQVHKVKSIVAARKFIDHSLDFVYIGDRRDRQKLLEDLDAWTPKLRPGGMILGRDYVDCVAPIGRCEVKSTVDEWAAAMGLPVSCTGEWDWPTWLISLP